MRPAMQTVPDTMPFVPKAGHALLFISAIVFVFCLMGILEGANVYVLRLAARSSRIDSRRQSSWELSCACQLVVRSMYMQNKSKVPFKIGPDGPLLSRGHRASLVEPVAPWQAAAGDGRCRPRVPSASVPCTHMAGDNVVRGWCAPWGHVYQKLQ